MYVIDSINDVPDFDVLIKYINNSMKRGVKIKEYDNIMEVMVGIKENHLKRLNDIGIPVISPDKISKFMIELADDSVTEIAFDGKKWHTDKNVLKSLIDRGYEFAELIQKYRKVNHAISVLETLRDIKRMSRDGLIRPSVSLLKTRRIQYSEPNLLGIPKIFMWNIICSRNKNGPDGGVLYSIDIKNQEAAILIGMLGVNSLREWQNDEKGLYDKVYEDINKAQVEGRILYIEGAESGITDENTYLNEGVPRNMIEDNLCTVKYIDKSGKKIVALRTKLGVTGETKDIIRRIPKILGNTVTMICDDGEEIEGEVNWWSVTKSEHSRMIEIKGEVLGLKAQYGERERREVKTTWIAIPYGISKRTILEQYSHYVDGGKIYDYMNSIPEFKRYKDKKRKDAKDGINVTRTYFGTSIKCDGDTKSKVERQLMSLGIQGTGLDILILLVTHALEEFERRNISNFVEIYFTRHDELVLDIDKEWFIKTGKEKVEEILKDIFEHRIDDWEPFHVVIKKVSETSIEDIVQEYTMNIFSDDEM